MTLSRGHHWIGWHGKRQLVDDYTRELVAAHIDALPETRGREQHRIWRLAKLPEQSTLRSAALHETWIVDLRGHAFIKFVHARVAGRKHKRAAFGRIDDFDYFISRGASPLRRARVRHRWRQIKHGL